MDFGDQRAGRVNHSQIALPTRLAHFRGNAVRAVDDPFAGGDLFNAVYEDGALLLQLLDNETVMNNFLADVNGRAKSFERNSHDIDCAHHPCTEAPGLQKKQSLAILV